MTHTVLMGERTDRLTAALLTSCCLRAGSSREQVKGVACVFWDASVRTRRVQQERRGEHKHLVLPRCVQGAKRDVEYQDDPEVEEVLSHQHSILVLHDPLQVDCT